MKKQRIVWKVIRKIVVALLLVFIIASNIVTLHSCCGNTFGKVRIRDGKIVVLPPTRIGKSITKVQFEKEYTFKSAFAESDMVAHIRIGNWKSEDSNRNATYYRATVLHQYKGDEVKNIILRQSGSSESTSYPLFTYGNELLVFCKKAEGKKDSYWILGSFTTVLDAATTESGELYFLDRYGILGERTETLTNYSYRTSIKRELEDILAAQDPIISEFISASRYQYVFSAKELEELIAEGILK